MIVSASPLYFEPQGQVWPLQISFLDNFLLIYNSIVIDSLPV